MPIKFYAPHWGNLLPFDVFCQNAKQAGYYSVEMALPLENVEKQRVITILEEHNLALIGQFYQSFEKDFTKHCDDYECYLINLAELAPVLINCQTGKDYYTFDQNTHLFEKAAEIAKRYGVKIIHETHRGKSLFAAHITMDYLKRIPDLRICLDISHWCNVHESLLEDQQEAVELAIQHTAHIHSRVGHQQGPQVNDPRAPEWAETLNMHLGCWDKVLALHTREGSDLTITTEFGPACYMPVLPYTGMPVANQWEVNVYMMNILKERYDINKIQTP